MTSSFYLFLVRASDSNSEISAFPVLRKKIGTGGLRFRFPFPQIFHLLRINEEVARRKEEAAFSDRMVIRDPCNTLKT